MIGVIEKLGHRHRGPARGAGRGCSAFTAWPSRWPGRAVIGLDAVPARREAAHRAWPYCAQGALRAGRPRQPQCPRDDRRQRPPSQALRGIHHYHSRHLVQAHAFVLVNRGLPVRGDCRGAFPWWTSPRPSRRRSSAPNSGPAIAP